MVSEGLAGRGEVLAFGFFRGREGEWGGREDSKAG